MLVKAQYKGHAVTSLRVGRQNARRYFARSAPTIQLELGHLCIECGLPPDFWQGEAELRDWRLCAWLESKHNAGGSLNTQVTLTMIPSGENSFKIALVA
jgi:hypothetical protein